jgi:hypothetical protein
VGSLPDEVARSIVKDAISHLTKPDVQDWILHVWGSTKGRTVDEAKSLIGSIVETYVAGGTPEDVRVRPNHRIEYKSSYKCSTCEFAPSTVAGRYFGSFGRK